MPPRRPVRVEGALRNAKFRINTPEELLTAIPDGAATKCKAGDAELTAGDAGKVLKASDFPFRSAPPEMKASPHPMNR